ncbi:MAG TPA: hypothetical protein PK037_05240 [Saprospiraceae bacterium]|nr:hypothetical protein [Saprospiraceae bacterium]
MAIPTVVENNARTKFKEVAVKNAIPNTALKIKIAPVTPSGFFQNDFGVISDIEKTADY